jgi:hypothetical protein
MRSGLGELARAVPPPHVTECELYLDQVLARLHGLVDEIRVEERDLEVLKERRRRVRQVLREETEDGGEGREE